MRRREGSREGKIKLKRERTGENEREKGEEK